MRKIFLFLINIIYLSLVISCKMQSAEDKLAIKLSQSPTFTELMENSKQITEQIKKYKADTTLTVKYKNLDSIQKRDSMLKYLLRTDSFPNISIKFGEAAVKINKEFPEFTMLSAESKKIVFKKAAALWGKNK